MSLMISIIGVLACILLVHLVAHFGQRLSPSFALPATGARWLLAAALLALGVSISGLALDASWLSAAAVPLDLADRGASGALAATGLTLAALVLLTALLHVLVPRRRPAAAPASALALLLGVAADGTALEAARRPLRWGAHGLALALVVALAFTADAIDPAAWGLAVTALVAASRALAPPLTPAAHAPPAALAPALGADPVADFHRALGSPPLIEREAAVPGDPETFVARASAAIAAARAAAPGPPGAAPGAVIALCAPDGAGKQRVAERLAADLDARGATTLWIDDHPHPSPAHHTLPELLDALARAVAFPRLGAIVVTVDATPSGEALATLRYAVHRLRALAARPARPIDVLVLGKSASLVTVARAIGAAEPHLVTPAERLPTRTILRYLLPAPPPRDLAAAAPADVTFATLDRPSVAARYPAARAGGSAREYLVPTGGPRGRRMREDRAQSLTRGQPPRLLAALPGDRDAPLARDALARFHLRSALAEAPQDPARLRDVFSPGLVDRELAALERANLLIRLPSWRPDPASATGIVPAPRLMARLPRTALAPAARATLVEPRGGRRLTVSADRLELDCYDGAIVALEPGPTAQRFEVRHGAAERVLVETDLAGATPLRTLAVTLTAPPTRARLRFRGARDVEVWEAPVAVHATHHGVKQFSARPVSTAAADSGPEARAYTRLLAEPRPLPALGTAARLVVLDGVGDPAMHAVVHAVREVIPLFVDNASDLGVTWISPAAGPAELAGRSALVFYDAHPDGLGTTADLRDDDLERLLSAAHALLECDCAAHCARCCESVTCTSPVAPDAALPAPDRKAALAALAPIVTPAPIPLGVRARHELLRRSA